MTKVKTIGIIGAGYAGVSSARILKAFGYDVVVFEKEPDIGGVWAESRRYPGLTTQNPKDTYNFSEMRMPKSYPEWPNGDQVQKYIESYSKKFDIFEDIQFCSEVVKAEIDPDTGKWTLKIKSTNDIQTNHIDVVQVDFLVVCNGIFSVPYIPPYSGSEKFRSAGGLLIHTSEFNDIELARDKNVVVVGYGKSSCDVARACIDVSASNTVIVRNLIWKIPKKFLKVLNFKYILLNRLGESMFKYIHLRGFEKFLHSSFGLPIRNAFMLAIQGVISWQFQLKKNNLHPEKSFETIGNTTISLVSDGFYEGIQTGKIRMIKNASIVELHERKATFSTGESVNVDIVVCGTGWKQEVPFFDEGTMSKILDAKGNFKLYRSIMPVDVPNLAFNGYGSSLMCQLNCEVGALWIVDMLNGGLSLPAASTQRKWIASRLAWMDKRTNGKHSKGTNLIPFTLHHIDELLLDMKLTLSPFTRLKQWLVVADPKDYGHLLKKLLARHER